MCASRAILLPLKWILVLFLPVVFHCMVLRGVCLFKMFLLVPLAGLNVPSLAYTQSETVRVADNVG